MITIKTHYGTLEHGKKYLIKTCYLSYYSQKDSPHEWCLYRCEILTKASGDKWAWFGVNRYSFFINEKTVASKKDPCISKVIPFDLFRKQIEECDESC